MQSHMFGVYDRIRIIIMVILKCYFSREHIALSYKKWCEHRIRKNERIKSTAHDENHTWNKCPKKSIA